MTNKPLYIAFMWHMHQPYYKNPFSGVYTLPWVRLHGVKDYLDTLKILEEFPAIKQTFNVVPSLLEQLNDYTENNARDYHLELTLMSPSDLNEQEKLFIIEYFFLANWETMVKPYPRYYELLMKRGLRYSKSDISRTVRYFTDQDIRDLQVYFNLTWIDPMFREGDPFLKQLLLKQRDYSEEEKRLLINKQFEILTQIIPEYRKLASSGQIEISVSPFYHPILPLLWDTDSARMAMPKAKLPGARFSHPEDAIRQIKMGIEFYEKTFGRRPAGMWPSEGSVSADVAGAIRAEDLKWIATDEEVLARSLDRPLRDSEGHVTDFQSLYRPYKYAGLSLFFRDHRISDQIGFVYAGWNADRAVNDFMGRLAQIRDSLPADRPYIVPVILDGENAWEYYQNDGHDFLNALYTALSNDSRFKTVTMSEFISEHGPGEPLKRLHSGSWINADFHIWIGHEEDNLAWDYLSRTRNDLEEFEKNTPQADLMEAWKALYAAEGSDWNWWYGEDHTTETAVEFDELFRSYLMKVYSVMGKPVPPNIFVPILIEDRKIAPDSNIKGFIFPKIDGMVTSYFEWYNSGRIEVKMGGGSMHKSESSISDVYYGFNKDSLFVRVDPIVPLGRMEEKVMLHIDIFHPSVFKIVFDPSANESATYERRNEEWISADVRLQAASADIFEIEIPFSFLKAKEGDEIHFAVEVVKNGGIAGPLKGAGILSEKIMERCPSRGHITLVVPSPDFEKIMWY